MEFDENVYRIKLKQLRATPSAIQALSDWCLERKDDHQAPIVDNWLSIFKKGTSKQRLNLFYLANEICQSARRMRSTKVISSFETVVKEAVHLIQANSIRPDVERLVQIWKERNVFDRDFVHQLEKLLTAGKLRQEKLVEEQSRSARMDFRPEDFVKELGAFSILERSIDKAREQLNKAELECRLADRNKHRDRRDVAKAISKLDDTRNKANAFCRDLEKHAKLRTKHIDLLEAAIDFFEEQRGEVANITFAYTQFGDVIEKTTEKLKMLRDRLPISVTTNYSDPRTMPPRPTPPPPTPPPRLQRQAAGGGLPPNHSRPTVSSRIAAAFRAANMSFDSPTLDEDIDINIDVSKSFQNADADISAALRGIISSAPPDSPPTPSPTKLNDRGFSATPTEDEPSATSTPGSAPGSTGQAAATPATSSTPMPPVLPCSVAPSVAAIPSVIPAYNPLMPPPSMLASVGGAALPSPVLRMPPPPTFLDMSVPPPGIPISPGQWPPPGQVVYDPNLPPPGLGYAAGCSSSMPPAFSPLVMPPSTGQFPFSAPPPPCLQQQIPSLGGAPSYLPSEVASSSAAYAQQGYGGEYCDQQTEDEYGGVNEEEPFEDDVEESYESYLYSDFYDGGQSAPCVNLSNLTVLPCVESTVNEQTISTKQVNQPLQPAEQQTFGAFDRNPQNSRELQFESFDAGIAHNLSAFEGNGSFQIRANALSPQSSAFAEASPGNSLLKQVPTANACAVQVADCAPRKSATPSKGLCINFKSKTMAQQTIHTPATSANHFLPSPAVISRKSTLPATVMATLQAAAAQEARKQAGNNNGALPSESEEPWCEQTDLNGYDVHAVRASATLARGVGGHKRSQHFNAVDVDIAAKRFH